MKPTEEQLATALPNNPPGADTTPNEGHTEWFEVYNTTSAPVVMDGWTLADGSNGSTTTIGSFTIEANSYAVFSGFNIPEAQGGVIFDYFYDYKAPSFNNESSYADEGDTSCLDGVIISKSDGTLVDQVLYDYGYGNYIGNPNSGSCVDNAAAIGFSEQNGSSRVSFMLNVDPAVMNSEANDLAANWVFSTSIYDVEGDQTGTPGEANDGTTSVNDPELGQAIDVFPNPANKVLNIATDLEGAFQVEFFNLVGQQMGKTEINNRSIDVSNLAVGVYSMKITVGEKSTVKKVVVQR